MQVAISCTTIIDIATPKLEEICLHFGCVLKIFIGEFFRQILVTFAEDYIQQMSSEIRCDKCQTHGRFIWKTHNGEKTSILTLFGMVFIPQLQVQCRACGHKMYLTRQLLGIGRYVRLPEHTKKHFGLIGALTTFRVAQKIAKMFGVILDKMSIWRSVQEVGSGIKFDLDPDECAKGEADGTGIPINGIEKRGQELKVFVQMKKSGGVRVAGLTIGNYDSGWEKLFAPLIEPLKTFKDFLLITDGDTSILKGLAGKVTVLFQRCLWHLPHQFKWYLWKDGVKRKTTEWMDTMGSLLNISNVKFLQHDKECVDAIVKQKKEHLDKLILLCRDNGWKHCATYLENAKEGMFTALSNRLNGKTTSHVERVMKTVNMRTNVGKWSPSGVLNAMKIRLAYYYNGFDVN